MSLPLYERVALKRDLPEEGLKKGDVAVLVDSLLHPEGGEPGCVLEVFNAVGESIAVVAVRESDIEALRDDEVLAVRLRLPDEDALVARAVADAVAHEPETAAAPGRSRWALLVERIEQDAKSLGEYRDTFDRDRKEFRESFRFRREEED